jgi:hypothetical protein
VNSEHYRAGLVGINVVLVLLIAMGGFRAFQGASVPDDEMPPDRFNPVRYDIKDEGNQESSLEQFRVVSQVLDRPERRPDPVVQPPPENPNPPPVVQTPQDLASLYELLIVQENPDPSRSAFMIRNRRGGNPKVYGVGDSVDGYRVVSVDVVREGEAVVVVDNRGRDEEIRFVRPPNR